MSPPNDSSTLSRHKIVNLQWAIYFQCGLIMDVGTTEPEGSYG